MTGTPACSSSLSGRSGAGIWETVSLGHDPREVLTRVADKVRARLAEAAAPGEEPLPGTLRPS